MLGEPPPPQDCHKCKKPKQSTVNTPKKKGKEYYPRTGNSLSQRKHRRNHNITKMHTRNKVGGTECHHHPTKMQ
eukprot:343899-Ditylum_brightwellii.AAC.1